MTEPAPIVHTAQGSLRGVWRGGSAAFLGIPFAEAPVGDLRFAAPVAAGGWQGVRDATQYGPTPQRRPFAEVTSIPEPSFPGDATLNVNVFTPRPGEPDAALPVLFWIHGGGYKAGSPSSPWYDGAAFNRDGVVTVSVSYRLGFDGFGLIDGAPANRGLLDQIAGLAWVRDHIAAFGGDPGNVTIAGQSAGGGSVLALLASPAAAGLFHAAICHSGALEPPSASEAASRTAALAVALGIPATLAGFRSVSEDAILDATDAMGGEPAAPDVPAEALIDGLLTGPALGGIVFVPHLDAATLPDPVAAVGASPIPLVLGTVAHEFTMFGMFLGAALADADVPALLRASVVGPIADDYVAAHPELAGPMIVGQLMTDTMFRAPLVAFARARTAPTWAYDFRWPNATTGLATHCSEIPFAWDHLDEPAVATSCGPDAPQALADAMHADWVRFVTSHDMDWARWDAATSLAKVYDDPVRVEPRYGIEAALLDRLRG